MFVIPVSSRGRKSVAPCGGGVVVAPERAGWLATGRGASGVGEAPGKGQASRASRGRRQMRRGPGGRKGEPTSVQRRVVPVPVHVRGPLGRGPRAGAAARAGWRPG